MVLSQFVTVAEPLKVVVGNASCEKENNDGTVWSCGNNQYGQLGHGDTTNRFGYEQSKLDNSDTVITDVKAISAGDSHSLVLKNNEYHYLY